MNTHLLFAKYIPPQNESSLSSESKSHLRSSSLAVMCHSPLTCRFHSSVDSMISQRFSWLSSNSNSMLGKSSTSRYQMRGESWINAQEMRSNRGILSLTMSLLRDSVWWEISHDWSCFRRDNISSKESSRFRRYPWNRSHLSSATILFLELKWSSFREDYH